MSDPPRKPILNDHKRQGRRLVPPLLASLGERYLPYSWLTDLVPEAVWLALMIEKHGFRAASRLCANLAIAAADTCNADDVPLFNRMSSFLQLSPKQICDIQASLDDESLNEISDALQPLTRVFPDHPLSGFAALKQEHGDQTALVTILPKLYDRTERLAVQSMAIAYFVGLEQGKVHVAPHLVAELIKDFTDIEAYPDTDASEEAASSFRAAAPMILQRLAPEGEEPPVESPWKKQFWDGVAGTGPCVGQEMAPKEDVEGDGLEAFVATFRNSVKADLLSRLGRFLIDLNRVDYYEVVSALLSRQASLAVEFAAAPGAWTPNCAPILLRAMADVFITLSWILADPDARSKRFVEDGLGVVKLEVAHRERELPQLSSDEEKEAAKEIIAAQKAWLAGQRLDALVEINLGSWSGLSARKMAEETENLDFYNYVYQPFSSCVHSNWFHISMYNTTACENPAHRWHRLPVMHDFNADAFWLYLCAKYYSKTLRVFDRAVGLDGMNDTAFDLFSQETAR